jgi:hypothetical protein
LSAKIVTTHKSMKAIKQNKSTRGTDAAALVSMATPNNEWT